MDIDSRLLQEYPLNEQQKAILKHEDGPLLVIAGPGTGKTLTLILRAMNLLVHAKAKPSEIILCTYTDKAAHEMHDRIMTLARKLDYREDLSELRVGTIHSICNQLVKDYRHHTPLGNDYETLNKFSQQLFIFQHLHRIGQNGRLHFFSEKWGHHWQVARRLQEYFDKIMEELIDEKKLLSESHPFIQQLAQAYATYCKLLIHENRISFSAQLKIAYNLLTATETCNKITQGIRYVFVDEYQDTNYIQEQIILKLVTATNNLCVVGDEDQALYRFRGATVRNILEFAGNVSGCTTKYLTINYRSHPDIVRKYDRWMATGNWSEEGKLRFRHDKTIEPHGNTTDANYPSVLSILGKEEIDEAEQFAEFVFFLKSQDIITDYNQVALLLYSVKSPYSDRYIEALQHRGIPFFCPRARSYFCQQEVRLVVACFALLLHYYGEQQGELLEHENFSRYVQGQCIDALNQHFGFDHPLQKLLKEFESEIATSKEALLEDQNSNACLTDYFYRLLAVEPFATFVKDERRVRNLVIFSNVLGTFQNFYRYTAIVPSTLEKIRYDFFYIFLRLLQDEGVNEYEDMEQPFPQGYVQIMTIHQAKGLEIPVVVVGSLNKGHTGAEEVDRDLRKFYPRHKEFEPESRIPGFDMMRLYYVAFSRAEKLLVLTGNLRRPPKQYFNDLLEDLPRWPDAKHDLLAMSPSRPKEPVLLKRHYSFTGHIQMYETCPRQYQYFQEYNFAQSRQREVFLGLLVHQTIEEMHRIVLDGKFALLNESKIQKILEWTYACLLRRHLYPLNPSMKERAFTQIYNYFKQNRREMQQIIETEVDIMIEKESYILTGRIDLLRESNGVLELLDFKTEARPPVNAIKLVDYERQLCTYAHALEWRYGRRPERLLLYWTQESLREDALMEIHYRPEVVEQVERSFTTVVNKIKGKDFRIITVPEREICTHCDMYHYCLNEGTIAPYIQAD